MKTNVKKLLRIVTVAIAAVAIITLITLFTLSYKAIDSLTTHTPSSLETTELKLTTETSEKSQESPPTVLQVNHTQPTPPKKGKMTDEAFTAILEAAGKLEAIENEIAGKSLPDICSNLCNESRFTSDKELTGSGLLESMVAFYEEEGPRAFEDPRFFIAYEMAQAKLISMIPESTRKFLIEIRKIKNSKQEISSFEKARLATWAQKHILESIYAIQTNLPKSKLRLRYLLQLKDLRKQCTDESRSEIVKKCQEIGI